MSENDAGLSDEDLEAIDAVLDEVAEEGGDAEGLLIDIIVGD